MAEGNSELAEIVPDIGPAISPDTEPLVGRHVRAERLKDSDFPLLWLALGEQAEIWTHWPEGPYENADQFTNAWKGLLTDPNIIAYTVLYRGKAAGCLFLQVADLDSRVIEMGLMYGPSLQRTREGTEAIYLLIRSCFDKLRNRRVEWKTSRLNIPSQRAAERYGLVYEGCLRQHRIYKGRNRDTYWYSMLDSEWPVCKRAFEVWLDDANFDEQGRQKRSLGDIRQSLSVP